MTSTPPGPDNVSRWTDVYFQRTRAIVEKFGDQRVTYAVFMRRPVVFAPRLALDWLRQIAGARGFTPEIQQNYAEGKWVGAGEPMFWITGPFSQMAELETLFLMKLGPACVAAYNAYMMCAGLPKVAFLAMDARHCAGTEMAEIMALLIVLRGAMDGLGAIAPYADPDYRSIRGELALAEPGQPDGLLDLDGHFGLHPALAPIHGWWAEKQLLAVHAIATPYRERSHFDAQDLLESGGAKPAGQKTGWLNRALDQLHGHGSGLGLALGQGVPLVMRGAVPVASWAPSPLPEPTTDFLSRVMDIYQKDTVLGPALSSGLGIADMAQMASGVPAGQPKPKDRQLMATTAGRMLADPAGPRVAVMDMQGWDTHVGQGSIKGRLPNALADLAEVMGLLREGLGESWNKSVIAVVTEFGRTVRPNGTGGTDHGTAGVALLAGAAIEGGRMLGKWPGLRDDKLYEGRDLAPTTDMRALLKAVLTDHLGVPGRALDAHVFPDGKNVRPLADVIRT